MLDVFIQTLPFFALVGLGFGAGKTGFFPPEATAYLTRFVFYFALSAMMLRFSAELDLKTLLSPAFLAAYALGTAAVFGGFMALAKLRKRPFDEQVFEGYSASISNSGFLGIPLITMLFGEAAIGPLMLVMIVDFTLFAGAIVAMMTFAREGRLSWAILPQVGKGLVTNPMIMALVIGLTIAGTGIVLAEPVDRFLATLASAATPGALFALGASLASRKVESFGDAGLLSFGKLVVHPLAVGALALAFGVLPFEAAVMVAVAALPVAGTTFILAQHYGVATGRVSAAVFVSTVLAIFTLPAVVTWVTAWL